MPAPAPQPTLATVVTIQTAIKSLGINNTTAAALKAIAEAANADTTSQAVHNHRTLLGFTEGTLTPDLTQSDNDKTVRQAAAYHLIAANIDATDRTLLISNDNPDKVTAVLKANNASAIRSALHTLQGLLSIDFKMHDQDRTENDRILSDRQATALKKQLARKMLEQVSTEKLVDIASANDLNTTRTALGDAFPQAIKDNSDKA